MDEKELYEIGAYSLSQEEKEKTILPLYRALTEFHYRNCDEYKCILNLLGNPIDPMNNFSEIPYVPIRIFKDFRLHSVPEEQIVKTLYSSGTTGQEPSKVLLDATNSKKQQKVLAKILLEYVGAKRVPLLILDSKKVVSDRKNFQARGAGIIGISIIGKDITYAFDENMNLDYLAIEKFIQRNLGENIVLFGYTYVIWQEFCNKLIEMGMKFDFGEKSLLFHVGGWKKLEHISVSKEEFITTMKSQCGVTRVHNYYGMVEQLGSIFVECEYGHLHCSNFSDVIIRRKEDFSEASLNEIGIVEVLSLLPTSYPGHAILTEDKGRILGIDDCKCGRKGKYFEILGRIAKAEIRGCSDTYK